MLKAFVFTEAFNIITNDILYEPNVEETLISLTSNSQLLQHPQLTSKMPGVSHWAVNKFKTKFFIGL